MTEEQHVVVAVDGSEENRAALGWAVDAAERAGAPLLVATAAEPYTAVGPAAQVPPPQEYAEPIAAQATREAAERLGSERVGSVVRLAHPVNLLRTVAEGQRLLVVGKRGMGAFGRLLLGSTSIAVAGRAPAPVVVVPAGWDVVAHRDAPVVVGVDLDKEHRSSLHHAFAVAAELGVPLDVVQVWEPHPAVAADPTALAAAVDSWRDTGGGELAETLAGLVDAHPGVRVRLRQEAGQPVRVLLEVAEGSQLLVLGRDAKERISGFALGSVARGVLHHSEVPVAVVPDRVSGSGD